MTRLASVALVVAALFLVRRMGMGGAAAAESGTALALGFTLIVALVTGEFLRRFRLPRLTGYLLFGLLLGPYLGNVITETMARQLQTVNGIATTLIAFIAGLTLNFERLGRACSRRRADASRRRWRSRWSGCSPWSGSSGRGCRSRPTRRDSAKLAMAALFVVIVISFSPTMTAAVIAETGARGRLSDLVLAIVVLADLVVLVLFSLADAARHA